ncbi:Receptor expression-enhancing protein 5 [Toxocara canis]|uniref:Receptor expression-enhancing protein n=1 Tax=Toxocara canis TaxID=6265 RepID=A0A0B2VIR0_TOXCA|nr:Receptor expression-enhancing protein 5 [Toxocara canis]
MSAHVDLVNLDSSDPPLIYRSIREVKRKQRTMHIGKKRRSRSLPKAARNATVNSFADIQPQFVTFLYENKNITLNSVFAKFEESTGARREHLAYAVVGIIAFYLIIGQCAELLCNLIGFAYPAYASVKAIRTPEKDDDMQWLTYWTVFAFFSLLDFFAHAIMDVVPLYWLAKVIFLLYLALPQTFGATKIYIYYVDPAVAKLEEALAKKSREE